MNKWIMISALVLFIAYLVFLLTGKEAHSVEALSCPVYTFTGFECAGCGSQRAILHLLNFEFWAAFRQNPVLFILIPYVLLGLITHYFPALLKYFPKNFNDRFFGSRAAVTLLIVLLIWTIVRNF